MPGFEQDFNNHAIMQFDRHTQGGFLPAQTVWRQVCGFQDIMQGQDLDHIPNAQQNHDVAPISQPSCASTQIQLSDTQQFTPVARGQIVCGQRHQEFWFAADVPVDAILAVWGDFYMIDVQQAPEKEFPLRLVPNVSRMNAPNPAYDGSLIALFHEGNLTIYEDNRESVAAASMHATESLWDQFGQMPTWEKPPTMVVTHQPFPETDTSSIPMPQFVLAADCECTSVTKFSDQGELSCR